jgi:hypothetical protein
MFLPMKNRNIFHHSSQLCQFYQGSLPFFTIQRHFQPIFSNNFPQFPQHFSAPKPSRPRCCRAMRCRASGC